MTATASIVLSFWAMQVAATLLFKFGADAPGRWWIGFGFGNLLGASSIWLLMLLYQRINNPNIANIVGGAGAFILAQVAIALAFQSRLTALQWLGILAVAIGMGIVAFGGAATSASR